MKTANLVILRSPDLKAWEPVLPKNVPEWVKDPEVIGHLVTGHMVQDGNEEVGYWYRAEEGPKPMVVLPNAPNLKHKPAALDRVRH